MPQTRKRKLVEKSTTDEGGTNKSSRKPDRGKKCCNVSKEELKTQAFSNKAEKGRKTRSNDPNKKNSKNIKTQIQNKQESKLAKPKVALSSARMKWKAESQRHIGSSVSGIMSECSDVTKDIKSNLMKTEVIIPHVKEEPEVITDADSSSESEWEEVEERCDVSLDDYKPDIPAEGVEITIDCPDLTSRKRTKKKFDENEWIRLHINRDRKDVQLSMHKTHLLCLLAHGIYVNQILNSDSLKALALSLISDDLLSSAFLKKIDKLDESGIQKLLTWFRSVFSYEAKSMAFDNVYLSLQASFQSQRATSCSEYNLMFIIAARTLGLKVRFCLSLNPVTFKASNLIKKPDSKRHASKAIISNEDDPPPAKSKKTAAEPKNKPKKMKLKNSDCDKPGKSSIRPQRSEGKNYKMSSDENDSNDEDYVMEENLSNKGKKTLKQNSDLKRRRNRKILSSDSELGSRVNSPELDSKSSSVISWAEIFCKPKKQWMPVECVNNIINDPYSIEALAPQPVSYIIAIDNESFVKDVTRRYCNEYMTSTLKLRVDPDWWEETLQPFLPPHSKLNKEEEKKLDEILVNKPLPTTLQGFKNHPLYALKRHLLKFEAIYPPDAPPVGFFRKEPVYARDCVHHLYSRETWLKEARVVRIGEEPYKIVKARPKWDKIAGVLRTDLPLEIFGEWQTEPYEPPIAVGGKVPRNEYGNVELFKPCMLPKGTVYLQLPGLNRIAKKLNIDCSAAVVGFDGHKGSVHPVFDGFVVCEEFKDVIIAAWDEEQENIRKREEEKREKRVYGNWKKLIKGLLIRERIKLKYSQNEKSNVIE